MKYTVDTQEKTITIDSSQIWTIEELHTLMNNLVRIGYQDYHLNPVITHITNSTTIHPYYPILHNYPTWTYNIDKDNFT